MVRRRRARGFTMIELLISMALASIGLLGLLALQVTATRGNATSRNFIEAVAVAQERLEMAEVEKFANLGTLVSGAVPCTAANGSKTNISGSTMDYYVCTTESSPSASTTNVRVDVFWTEYSNSAAMPHTLSVTTTRSP